MPMGVGRFDQTKWVAKDGAAAQQQLFKRAQRKSTKTVKHRVKSFANTFASYGEDQITYSGPVYSSMKVEGDKVRLSFRSGHSLRNHLHLLFSYENKGFSCFILRRRSLIRLLYLQGGRTNFTFVKA
jgi:CRISPR/Cas system-associated exonuclease Cas4 (RecB family)